MTRAKLRRKISETVKRRNFLQAALLAAVSAPSLSCSRTKGAWRFFSDEEARILGAICDRIIPPDQDPGATQAGVVNYIDQQLAGFFRQHQQTYREGIAAVDQASRARFGKEFGRLTAERQDELLTAMEKNEAPGEAWKSVSPRQFLDLVISHTMQGFYGDPRHGGNRDAVSWRMLGVPFPPVRGRDPYELFGRRSEPRA